MKKLLFIVLSFVALATGCQKTESSSLNETSGKEIVFGLEGDGIDFDVQTKASATAVTSVSKVYWEAKSGTTVTYAVAQYSVSSNKVSTAKYWPKSGATYSYMVANTSFKTSTGAISASNATDIVCGTASSVTSNTCTIALNHIFARTGTLTLNTQSGYTISGISWTIASKSEDTSTGTSGTYTIGTGWSTTGATALSSTTFTSSSDLYLIPGTYTVSVTYTLTKGAYSDTFTKSADVTLVEGKINSITGTASGGAASQITFNVSVTAWGSTTLTPTFS